MQIKSDIGPYICFVPQKTSCVRIPTFILIGEIRDSETAEIAISAAQTGHLVFSTLHTNDAAGAISRLISLGIPPFQVASALIGTVAQRLVRTICPRCKASFQMKEKEESFFSNTLQNNDSHVLYKGSGCNFCKNTGYVGRAGIYEILPVSTQIREMIVNECSTDQIRECAVSQGMRTLKNPGQNKGIKW